MAPTATNGLSQPWSFASCASFCWDFIGGVTTERDVGVLDSADVSIGRRRESEDSCPPIAARNHAMLACTMFGSPKTQHMHGRGLDIALCAASRRGDEACPGPVRGARLGVASASSSTLRSGRCELDGRRRGCGRCRLKLAPFTGVHRPLKVADRLALERQLAAPNLLARTKPFRRGAAKTRLSGDLATPISGRCAKVTPAAPSPTHDGARRRSRCGAR